MPLPKSLRRPVRRTSSASSAGTSQRKKCRMCNNLDPRQHANTVEDAEARGETRASLSLVLDALALSNINTSSRGCRFCAVLVQTLDAFFEKWRGARCRVNIDIQEKETIKVSLDGPRWGKRIVEIYAGSASRPPWPTLGAAHHIPVDAGSDESFNFIRRCIQGCLANPKHTLCKMTCELSVSAPKRLIDVGRSTRPICMVETQGKAFQYVALSHCWGSKPPLTATKASWAKLTVNIPFGDLPALFQDAVIITRQLGLRYLWIDSLCILQDSLLDWETEAAKMASIYQNSYVTISATNSGDNTAKCLAVRRKPVRIPYENTTKKEYAVRARICSNHHPDSDGNPAKPTGPLTSRAWALQEHALSTRVLHYTATELMFECRTSYRCECMPERRTRATTPALIPRAVASKDATAVWTAWHRIVEQYSSRKLTMPGDKLPAISGIASKIRKATHSEYIAGLWKNNLAFDLLWQRTTPALSDEDFHALETWRAPSFSWSSLNAPVTYYTPDDDDRATCFSNITLVAYDVIPTGLNVLGTVSDATLTIRGRTNVATISGKYVRGAWEYTLLIKGTSAIHMTHDCCLVKAEIKSDADDEQWTVRRAQTKQSLSEFEGPALCLSVARHGDFISGIVLGISERRPEAWERLGTFAAGSESLRHAEERDLVLV
ncbi:hypothetical protein OPT61_g4595 [Boeremia exigua]|uniref:Uncharacterized protein n=1 Tax=Boeremia exigua TaxID=749465 RepID=A0ACC2IDJ0_9PLEO|nr:hypothetical protein OPT61_g4595 [Boeremia exigua]